MKPRNHIAKRRLPDSLYKFMTDNEIPYGEVSRAIKAQLSLYGISRGWSTIMIDISGKSVPAKLYKIYMEVFDIYGYTEPEYEITDEILEIFVHNVLDDRQRNYLAQLLKEEYS